MKNKIASLMVLVIMAAATASLALLFAGNPLPAAEQEQSQLRKFSSYEELAGFLKTGMESARYSYGHSGSFGRGFASPMVMEASVKTTAAKESAISADYSTTNIQVEGVDEADILKNDGKYIYTIAGKKLIIVDAYPAENAKVVSETELKGTPIDIFVNKDRLVVFSRDYNRQSNDELGRFPYPRPFDGEATLIEVYDITDKETPVKAKDLAISGGYHGSRMIGDYVYAVANQQAYYYGGMEEPVPLPAIMENSNLKEVPASEIYYFDTPDYGYSYINVVALNTQDDAEEYTSKTYLAGNTQNMYVSTGNIYVTYTRWNSIYSMPLEAVDDVYIPLLPNDVAEKVKSIRDSNASLWQKMELIEEELNRYSDAVGENESRKLKNRIEEKTAELEDKLARNAEQTIIHRIAISEGDIDYNGQGSVPGHVLNQFSMDEHKGHFRIATTSTARSTTAFIIESQVKAIPVVGEQVAPAIKPVIDRQHSTNNIYVLDESLSIAGKIEDLAPGESIYSARFMGDRAYLVTFVKIDPLFVIDLSEPTNPRVLGKLKIPGYSDYLHPYDENHIIGIGKEATGSEQGNFAWYQGIKLALFDVTDPENPKEMSKYEIGDRGTDSDALHEHKAFLFDRQKNLLVIPVLLAEIDKTKYAGELPSWAYGDYTWQGAYVFNLDTENGFQLKGKVTHLPEGDDSLMKSGYYYGGSPYSVKRSLYMDNVLYTISGSKIKMNDLSDMSEVNSVKLPDDYSPYGQPGIMTTATPTMPNME